MSAQEFIACPNCRQKGMIGGPVIRCPSCKCLFCASCAGSHGSLFNKKDVCPQCGALMIALHHVAGYIK